jgi:chromosome segregation ATPase
MWNEIEEAMNDLQKALSNYKDYQKDYAVKEYNYRTALSKELVRLRAEGQAVTHLADIARGKPEIAKLRFERDIAEGLVNSASEGINFYKLKIRELEAQYNREYGNPRLGIGG